METLEGGRPKYAQLLSADALLAERRTTAPRLFAPALAVANLFFLAYFERFLDEDGSARSLELLLFLEAALFLLLAGSHFQSSSALALTRSAIFPISPWDRFVFVSLSNLRRGVILLWLGGTVLAFLVLFHRSLGEILFSPLLFSLLVLFLQSALAVLLLFARRVAASTSGVLWTLAMLTGAALLASLLFQRSDLISFFLPAHWVALALRDLRTGLLSPSAEASGALLVLIGATLLLARKFC